MTLLDEYLALGEPRYNESGSLNSLTVVEYLDSVVLHERAKVERRDAVIRLLARVAGRQLDPNITGHCGDAGCDECNEQAELRALLSAVERDFKEGA